MKAVSSILFMRPAHPTRLPLSSIVAVFVLLAGLACQTPRESALEWRERVHQEDAFDFPHPSVCYSLSHDAPVAGVDQALYIQQVNAWVASHGFSGSHGTYCMTLITVAFAEWSGDFDKFVHYCEIAVEAVEKHGSDEDVHGYFTAMTLGALDHCVAAKYFE